MDWNLAGLFASPYVDVEGSRLYWVVEYWVEKREPIVGDAPGCR